MELDDIRTHAKAEAKRWAAEATKVAVELAAVKGVTHHDASERHRLRVRRAELLHNAEQCSAQVAELAGQ